MSGTRITGAAHPATGLSVLIAAGGVYGYWKTRSVPSLVAGIAIGTLYGVSAKLINENQDYGVELATATSVILGGAMVPRAIKTRKALPVAFSVASILGLAYYGRRLYEQYA